VEEGEAKAF
jgi:hypothetical protein